MLSAVIKEENAISCHKGTKCYQLSSRKKVLSAVLKKKNLLGTDWLGLMPI